MNIPVTPVTYSLKCHYRPQWSSPPLQWILYETPGSEGSSSLGTTLTASMTTSLCWSLAVWRTIYKMSQSSGNMWRDEHVEVVLPWCSPPWLSLGWLDPFPVLALSPGSVGVGTRLWSHYLRQQHRQNYGNKQQASSRNVNNNNNNKHELNSFCRGGANNHVTKTTPTHRRGWTIKSAE